MKTKIKCLVIMVAISISAIVTANSVFSFENEIYWISLNYDRGDISLKDEISVKIGYAPDIKMQPEAGYKSEVVSFDNNILYSFKFRVPNMQCSDFLDPATKQVSGGCISLDQTSFVLTIPYFTAGKVINIYDMGGKKVFSTSIEHLARKCGNSICQEDESYKTCSQDCLSGSKDNYCDKIKDNKCDPDCAEKEDADCKSSGEIDIAIVYILFSALVVIIVLLIVYRKKKLNRPFER